MAINNYLPIWLTIFAKNPAFKAFRKEQLESYIGVFSGLSLALAGRCPRRDLRSVLMWLILAAKKIMSNFFLFNFFVYNDVLVFKQEKRWKSTLVLSLRLNY